MTGNDGHVGLCQGRGPGLHLQSSHRPLQAWQLVWGAHLSNWSRQARKPWARPLPSPLKSQRSPWQVLASETMLPQRNGQATCVQGLAGQGWASLRVATSQTSAPSVQAQDVSHDPGGIL